MRKISRALSVALIAAVFPAQTCLAQQQEPTPGQPIIVPSQSSVYNQNSVFLPTAPSVGGQDIVRGAGGISCQSAVASGGPYVDMGVIGSEDVYERNTTALYGRIVVPLSGRRKRVDCTKLYELEMTRLRMELELLRMGTMMPAGQTVTSDISGPFTPPPPLPVTAATSSTEEPIIEPAPIEVTARDPLSSQVGRAKTIDPNAPLPSLKPRTKMTATAHAPRVQMPVAEAHSPMQQLIAVSSAPSSGNRFVQLGLFSTRANAYKHLAQLRLTVTEASVATLIHSPSSVEPTKHEQGTVFKLKLGPMPSEEAVFFCTQNGPDCLVTGS